jgi:hypothetical protein
VKDDDGDDDDDDNNNNNNNNNNNFQHHCLCNSHYCSQEGLLSVTRASGGRWHEHRVVLFLLLVTCVTTIPASSAVFRMAK